MRHKKDIKVPDFVQLIRLALVGLSGQGRYFLRAGSVEYRLLRGFREYEVDTPAQRKGFST
jgi:hypothetical protein